MAESGKTEEGWYPLTTLYVYLTDRCNQFCRHCWIQPQSPESHLTYNFLRLQDLAAIIEEALPLGLAEVKLTGGEPLLHPEIREILELLRSRGLALRLETNGALCTPEIAALIASSRNPSVAVSLDGAEAQTHEWVRRTPGSFAAALAGLKNLVAMDLRPQIIMTVMRRNQEQLEALVRLGERVGAGSVKFNVLQPLARGQEVFEAGEALPVGELVALGRWVESELAARTGLPLFFHYPAAFRPLAKVLSEDQGGCNCCGIKGILGVLANGAYALCGIGQIVPELVLGQAAAAPLKTVWENHTKLQELRQGLPQRLQGVCGRCLMKEMCLGSCVAETYARSGSFWGPFWFCEAAEKLGLFPESRLAPN
jgi:SynChlorMet cassette radical SAM/SPASM protein ScmF